MPTDLTVVLRDQPGELARLGEVAVSAGVPLRGLAAFVHVLVDDDDVDAAKDALKRGRLKIADTREVLVADLGGRPGGLVDVMLALAEADVNVDLAYTVCGSKVVIATEDMRDAREALT